MKAFIIAILITMAPLAMASKECINLETGKIIHVADGAPCPFPYAEN
jgi:hypothetical protein